MTTTLRELMGLNHLPTRLKESALILIDCQNTYRQGVMKLDGVEEALKEASHLLDLSRDLEIPVIHIQHDAGSGTPYDVHAESGAITDCVAPIANEVVIVKSFPDSFKETDLESTLRSLGVSNLILAGFMTHMCVGATAQGAFNRGYACTVVAKATASRPLNTGVGQWLSARTVHQSALASMRDLYACVVDSADELL